MSGPGLTQGLSLHYQHASVFVSGCVWCVQMPNSEEVHCLTTLLPHSPVLLFLYVVILCLCFVYEISCTATRVSTAGYDVVDGEVRLTVLKVRQLMHA